MKTPDQLRQEVDKVVPLRPATAKRTKAGKGAQPPKQLSTIWADDIQLQLDTAGLVDGLLSSTGMTVLYGESGSGKTFVAIDLGCHIAAGRPWRDMAVEQGIVVYIAAEAPESVKRRIWAWKKHHKVEHLPVLVVQSTVDLLNGDADALVEFLEKMRAEHGRIALVVVDTLARAMTGNENAPDDMGKFVAACGRLREAGETHVLVVHHSGKDLARGARGHSSLRAATDVELEITNGEDGGAIRVTKHRDEAGGTSYGFKLETVELGTNAKGRMVTTCVVAEAAAPAAKVANAQPKGRNQRTVLGALGEALCEHGQPAGKKAIPAGTNVVTIGQWREQALRRLPGGDAKYKTQAFNRAMDRLVDEGFVQYLDDLVWLRPAAMVAKVANAVLPPLQPSPSRPEAKEAKVAYPFRDAAFASATDDGRCEPEKYDDCSDGLDPLVMGNGEERESFTPTAEWQEVPEGAILPSGLEIQMNMAGGPKLARLKPAEGEVVW